MQTPHIHAPPASWEDRIRICDGEEANAELIEKLVDHCISWDSRSEMRYVDGYYTSESVLSWSMCAYAYDKVPNMPFTLETFPLIQLHQAFMHKHKRVSEGGEAILITEANAHLVDEDGNLPEEISARITSMDLQELMSTLNGLEWTVFCDVFREERSEQWWWEAFSVFELCMRRAFYLATHTLDPNVINMHVYRVTWTADAENLHNGLARPVANTKGYASSGDEAGPSSSSARRRGGGGGIDDATSSEEENEEDIAAAELTMAAAAAYASAESAESTFLMRGLARHTRSIRKRPRPAARSEDAESMRQKQKIAKLLVDREKQPHEMTRQELHDKYLADARAKSRKDAKALLRLQNEARGIFEPEEVEEKDQQKKQVKAMKKALKEKRRRDDEKRGIFVNLDDSEDSDDADADKPKLKEMAEVSLDWVFDIDTISTYFWRLAQEHETEPTPAPAPRVELQHIRYWLFESARVLDETNVVDFRRRWYEDLIVTPSMVRIYMRNTPHETKPKARAVIVNFCESIYKKHCLTKEDVCNEEAGSTLLRLSTDAMFFLMAQAIDSGNIAEAVYRTSLVDANKKAAFPCIYRDRIRNLWVAHLGPMGGRLRYSAPSFTAAFACMRARMKATQMSPKVGNVDVSVWDERFLPEAR